MFCSSLACSSSSGSNSKNTPKSRRFKALICSSVFTLNDDIEFLRDSAVKGNSKASAIFSEIFSAILRVI